MEGDRITGVVAETKAGAVRLGAAVFGDATGDAELAWRAGAAVERPDAERRVQLFAGPDLGLQDRVAAGGDGGDLDDRHRGVGRSLVDRGDRPVVWIMDWCGLPAADARRRIMRTCSSTPRTRAGRGPHGRPESDAGSLDGGRGYPSSSCRRAELT
jgi:hypothetical protein